MVLDRFHVQLRLIEITSLIMGDFFSFSFLQIRSNLKSICKDIIKRIVSDKPCIFILLLTTILKRNTVQS